VEAKSLDLRKVEKRGIVPITHNLPNHWVETDRAVFANRWAH
jgi:hypothetical protein